jgi:sugar lactone lactonase YvrE
MLSDHGRVDCLLGIQTRIEDGPDDKTLIIGETFGCKLTAFDIAVDGSLSNRRVWASIYPHFPDGICLDEAGGVWVADPAQSKIIRVLEGGEITDEIDPGNGVFACMLGGEDGKRLFACTATTSGSEAAANQGAQIGWVDVEHAATTPWFRPTRPPATYKD